MSKRNTHLTLQDFRTVEQALRRRKAQVLKKQSTLPPLAQSAKKLGEEAVEVVVEATRLSDNQNNPKNAKDIKQDLIAELSQLFGHVRDVMQLAKITKADIRRTGAQINASLPKRKPKSKRHSRTLNRS